MKPRLTHPVRPRSVLQPRDCVLFGQNSGMFTNGSTALSNAGYVVGRRGVTLDGPGNSVVNTGTIKGTGSDALFVSGGTTIDNSGLIEAAKDGIRLPKDSVSSKLMPADQRSPFESIYMDGSPPTPNNPGMTFPVESTHEMPGPLGPCGPVAPAGPGAPVIPVGP